MSRVIRCDRCGRRYRGQSDWHATIPAPLQVGEIICPQCTSSEESADAELGDAATRHWATEQLTRYLDRHPPKNDA